MFSKIIRVLLILVTLGAVGYAFVVKPEVQSMLPDEYNPFVQMIHSAPKSEKTEKIILEQVDSLQQDSLQAPLADTVTIEN